MPPSKTGKASRLRKKEDKDARALVFMLERVKGRSIVEIAKDYNCSDPTVRNYLAYARREGLIVNNARQLIAEKLIPMALAVYEAHLEQADLEAAQDLLFGIGVLQKVSNIKHTQEADDTLESFRDAYFKAAVVVDQEGAQAALGTTPAIQAAPLPAVAQVTPQVKPALLLPAGNSQPNPPANNESVFKLRGRQPDLRHQVDPDLDE